MSRNAKGIIKKWEDLLDLVKKLLLIGEKNSLLMDQISGAKKHIEDLLSNAIIFKNKEKSITSLKVSWVRLCPIIQF